MSDKNYAAYLELVKLQTETMTLSIEYNKAIEKVKKEALEALREIKEIKKQVKKRLVKK